MKYAHVIAILIIFDKIDLCIDLLNSRHLRRLMKDSEEDKLMNVIGLVMILICFKSNGEFRYIRIIMQSLPGRNWRRSINSHVCFCMYEQLVLLIFNGICDPKFVYKKY